MSIQLNICMYHIVKYIKYIHVKYTHLCAHM